MAFADLSDAAREDLVVSLATLVLHDGGADVTAENITQVIENSGNKVQAFWSGLYAKLLENRKMDDLILKPGGGGGGAVAAAAGGDAAAEAEPEKEESEKEESAGGAGGLFDDDDDDW